MSFSNQGRRSIGVVGNGDRKLYQPPNRSLYPPATAAKGGCSRRVNSNIRRRCVIT